jgi:hypothetical protein
MALTDKEIFEFEWMRRGTTILDRADPALTHAHPETFATERMDARDPVPVLEKERTEAEKLASPLYRLIKNDPTLVAKYEELPEKP